MNAHTTRFLALILAVLLVGCTSVPIKAKKAGRTVAQTGEVVANKAEGFWNRLFGKKQSSSTKRNVSQKPKKESGSGFQTYAQPYVTSGE